MIKQMRTILNKNLNALVLKDEIRRKRIYINLHDPRMNVGLRARTGMSQHLRLRLVVSDSACMLRQFSVHAHRPLRVSQVSDGGWRL